MTPGLVTYPLGDTEMAKKSRKNRVERDVTNTPTHRYVSVPTRRPDPFRFGPVPRLSHAIIADRAIARIEDRRKHDPTKSVSPPKALRRSASRPRVDPRNLAAVAFSDPFRVSICAKRKERRRAIFAAGKGGRSRLGFKKRRTNFWSQVKCH